MDWNSLLWWLLIIPILCGLVCLVLRTVRDVLNFIVYAMIFMTGLVFTFSFQVYNTGRIMSSGNWLFADSLTIFHLMLMILIFLFSSVYARIYFENESEEHTLSLKKARRFGALWFGSLAAMCLVLISNNLGIMWVGIEATTLLTAFLICLYVTPFSLEATWKYIIVCSVGIAFAFMGILLIGAAASFASISTPGLLNWTELITRAHLFDSKIIKLAFIFLFVGYGTKAGLAPLHSWLPDAHSQAPAPVSAIFSGFLLNTALYCIMRMIPVIEPSAGTLWVRNILLIFGLGSMIISSAFIIAQHDLKRLLAYCSVEHIGIITLGLGLGPLGTFAALFHTFNHSLCKSLGFYSAGRIGQMYGTQNMQNISGTLKTNPVWGIGLLGSLLALIGVAPFSIFISEFLILKAAVVKKDYVTLVLFLIGTVIVFIGVLRHVIDMSFGLPEKNVIGKPGTVAEIIVVAVPLAILLILGLWMPDYFKNLLTAASKIVWMDKP